MTKTALDRTNIPPILHCRDSKVEFVLNVTNQVKKVTV